MNNSSSETTTTKNATPSTRTSAATATATTASKQTKISKLLSVGGRRKLVTGNSTPLHLKKELLDVSSPVIIRSFNANTPTCTANSATNKSLPTKRSLNPILLAAKNREPPKQPSNLQEILVYEDDNNPFLDDGNNAFSIIPLTEISPSKKPHEQEQEQEQKEKQHKQRIAKKTIPEPSKDIRLLKSSVNDKVPAFERFANLTGTTQMGLKLPKRFFHLENLLSLMDRLISLKSGRSEPFIFAKSIRSLESALGKRCEWTQLRMLFSLYKDGCGEVLYKIDRMAIIDNGKKINTASLSIPPPTTFKGSEHDYLAHRRSVVLSSMTKVMAKRHENFLSSINFSLPSGAQLKAWHPKFDYESSNLSDDDISLFEILPSDATVDVATATFKAESLISGSSSSSSKETLNAINSIIPNKKIESKLTNEKRASETLQNSQPIQTPSLPPKAPAGASSVLERIRKKQRDAELLRMGALESGETKEFLAQKHKLQNMIPLLDKIAMIFASSKKGALLLTEVRTRLMDSSNGLFSALEIIEQIDGLVKVIRSSGYLKSINAGGGDVGAESGPLTLRLTKEVPLQKAKECIAQALENLYKNK